MEYSAPRGTQDITPDESGLWQHVESVIRQTMALCGYSEIRTPIFEHTEVFERGVGATTDIVEKEMYTFRDRGDRMITLRPEGTAPAVRAYVEHRMASRPQPTKLYYIGPMFRYERPQAGRYRQFHQFGMEVIGVAGPAADVEVIATPLDIFRALGITDVTVNLNSIGCPVCRPGYRNLLKEVYAPVLPQLCPSCQSRYERNPLRLLDCKSQECRGYMPDPPPIFEYLCPECAQHFSEVRRLLDKLGVEYVLNPRLVRGLDYYNRTTFEYTVGGIGSQDAIGGGGRYDGLVEELGGQPTPAVGVACGMERCVLAMTAGAAAKRFAGGVDVFFVSLGERAAERVFELAFQERSQEMSADFDMMGRGLKAQMRYADKVNAKFVAIIGDNEIDRGTVALKDMSTGEQREVPMAGLASMLREGR